MPVGTLCIGLAARGGADGDDGAAARPARPDAPAVGDLGARPPAPPPAGRMMRPAAARSRRRRLGSSWPSGRRQRWSTALGGSTATARCPVCAGRRPEQWHVTLRFLGTRRSIGRCDGALAHCAGSPACARTLGADVPCASAGRCWRCPSTAWRRWPPRSTRAFAGIGRPTGATDVPRAPHAGRGRGRAGWRWRPPARADAGVAVESRQPGPQPPRPGRRARTRSSPPSNWSSRRLAAAASVAQPDRAADF